MKTKHTPGNWHRTIDDRIETTYPTKGKEEEVSPIESTHYRTVTICKFSTNLGSNILTEEQKANAQLIAAAPELLAYVIKMKKGYENLATQRGFTEHEADQYNELQGLINKATK